MTRATILLSALLIGAALGCAAPAAQITDDAGVELSLEDRVRTLREDLARYENSQTLDLEDEAVSRMRGWLDEMAGASEDDANLYEQAIRAQLEYLRTAELRSDRAGAGL